MREVGVNLESDVAEKQLVKKGFNKTFSNCFSQRAKIITNLTGVHPRLYYIAPHTTATRKTYYNAMRHV